MAISLIKNPDERNDPPKPLMEHLLALRSMIIFAFVAWGICFVFSCFFANKIFIWIQSPNEVATRLVNLNATGSFFLLFDIAFWVGTALSFPFLTFAVLRFIFPALTNREKYFILTVLCIGTVLFVAGVALAYTQTVPSMLKVFDSLDSWFDLKSQYEVRAFVNLVLKVLLAFGLVFQLPLIIFMLGWFGLVSSKALREKRRLAIVLSFVVSMFLTPPDPLSQIIMAVPMCILYELATWAVWIKEKSRG